MVYVSNFPPKLQVYLLKRIGVERYKLANKNMRLLMVDEELKKFRREIIFAFGSQSNYIMDWLRRQGFKRKIDYENMLAQRRGFKNMNAYENTLYFLKGFKNKADKQRFSRLRKKYPRQVSDFFVREVQLKKEHKLKDEIDSELTRFIMARRNSKRQEQKSSKYENLSQEVRCRNPVGASESVRDPSNGIGMASVEKAHVPTNLGY